MDLLIDDRLDRIICNAINAVLSGDIKAWEHVA